MDEPEESWPELVRAVIRDTQSRIVPELAARGLFSQAHVNWYPDGGVCVRPTKRKMINALFNTRSYKTYL